MKNFKLGLQLYSVREDMEKDMDSTLKAVKDMGYDYVEFAGYFGKTAEEVKQLLDKHGLKCISVHQSHKVFLSEPQKNIDYLKTIGVKFSAIPWYEISELRNNFEETQKQFEKTGNLLKDNGIQLLYHNHDFEFGKVDGEYILDKLFRLIPVMLPQIDTCWVRYMDINPAEYIEKYSGKTNIIHLKDFVCRSFGSGPAYALIGDDGQEEKRPSMEDNGFDFRPLGYGIQDFPAILAAAEKAGVEYLIVEQDRSSERPAMEAAKISREYLRTLGI